MIGPGKYDDLCTEAREKSGAVAVIMIMLGGRHGSGFSVQAPLDVQVGLPQILRTVADQIEKDMKQWPTS